MVVQTWVKGLLLADISAEGMVTANADNLEILPFPKPTVGQDYGQDPEVITAIRMRIPGRYRTTAHFGGATSVLVPSLSVALLSEGEMVNWKNMFKGRWSDWWMASLARNAKPRVWPSAISLAGGMFESAEFLWELLEEMLELGIFNDNGWLRYILPDSLRHLQERFDSAQEFWWGVVWPEFPCVGMAQIEPTGFGQDSLNGIKGVFTIGEELGDVAISQVVRVPLVGTGWRFLDTECRAGDPVQGEPDWVPMRRKPWLIAARRGKAPVALPLDSEGCLDGLGVPFAIDGENREVIVTDVTRGALDAWMVAEDS